MTIPSPGRTSRAIALSCVLAASLCGAPVSVGASEATPTTPPAAKPVPAALAKALDQVQADMRAGQWDKAIGRIETLTELFPDHAASLREFRVSVIAARDDAARQARPAAAPDKPAGPGMDAITKLDLTALQARAGNLRGVTDPDARRAAVSTLIADIGAFLDRHPDADALWGVLGALALEGDDAAAGERAGTRLYELGVLDDDRHRGYAVAVQLRTRGWLLTPDERAVAQRKAAEAQRARAEAVAEAKRRVPWASALGSDAQGTWADLDVDGVTQRLRLIPAGRFTMGGSEHESGHERGEVQHQVSITRPFWIGQSEVTQAMWQAVTGGNPSRFKGADRPVEQVSWDDCQRFMTALNTKVPGLSAMLPSEAQWEYACRAGDAGLYAGPLDAMGWYDVNSGNETHPVGQKQANAWGLFDMHGNVWEWCSDWHGDYPAGAVSDPVGPPVGSLRIVRGGSWHCAPSWCHSARRFGNVPVVRARDRGVRLIAQSTP